MNLVDLFHHKWAVRVLARLHERKGERFVVLYRKLGASEGAMRKTLTDLVEKGWVMKNPGYGHPLRPEYILTPSAAELGAACSHLVETVDASLLDGKWLLPLLHQMSPRARSFSELSQGLPGATDRALSLGLKTLIAAGAITRSVTDDFPPQTRYSANSSQKAVLQKLAILANLL